MKTFVFKCALLLAIVGGILAVGGAAYKQTNTYRNLERTEETTEYHEMPESIDIAILGASHGRRDFQYAPAGMTMFNFALSGQTPQYDAALLRQYQSHLRPGALVVLTFSYLSPYWTDTKVSFQNKQPRYYRILTPENIVDADLGRYWLGWLSPLLTLEPQEILQAFLTTPELVSTSDERGGRTQLSPEKLSDERDRIQRNHWSTISPVYPKVNPVMWDAYCEMLDLCRARGWNAVLVTPPYLEEYNNCYPQGFYEEFLRRAHELSEEYEVPYLDYSHDQAFTKHLDFFRDIDHLNLDGAAAFNERFFSDVQVLGLLG